MLIGLLWLSIGSSGGGLVITVKIPSSTEMAGNSCAYISLSTFQGVLRYKDEVSYYTHLCGLGFFYEKCCIFQLMHSII